MIVKQASPTTTACTHSHDCTLPFLMSVPVDQWNLNSHPFEVLWLEKQQNIKAQSKKQMPYLLQQWKIHNVPEYTSTQVSTLLVPCVFSYLSLISLFACIHTHSVTQRDCCQHSLRPSGLSLVWTNTRVYASWLLMLVVLAVMLAVACSDLCQHEVDLMSVRLFPLHTLSTSDDSSVINMDANANQIHAH